MTTAASRIRFIAGALLTSSITACGAFGPSRTPPAMVPPDRYAAREQSRELAGADGAAQRVIPGAPPTPLWWKEYGSAALDALVDEGLKNSPSLAAAQSTLEAARQSLRGQIGQSRWPAVDVGFNPSRQRALAIPTLPQPTFLYDVFAAEVKTSYTFDFFGAAVLADRALARQVQQQAFQFESVRRAIAANIVVATINAASLQEQVAATEELIAQGERRAQQVQARYELGSASLDETLGAQQDAANAAAALPALRAQALAVRHAQAVLLGRTPDQAPPPLPLNSLHVPGTVPLSVPSELLHQRPDILAAEAGVRAAADEAGAAAAALFPSLTLSASYGRGGFDWSTFTSPAGAIWSVGASLTQPLFHGGALVARKRQYEANYATAVSQYRQTVLAAFQNVADTLVSLEEDANALVQTERAADAARDLDRDVQTRYRLGALPLTDTLTARQQLASANLQSIRARSARLTDTAALFVSLGDPRRDGDSATTVAAIP